MTPLFDPTDALVAFRAALAATEPATAVRRHLRYAAGTLVVGSTPVAVDGEIAVLAVGKAAPAMAAAAVEITRATRGLVVTPYRTPSEHGIDQRMGDHPVPGAASVDAGKEASAFVASLSEGDVLLALVSGGSSACLELPVDGLTIDQVGEVTTRLLAAGVAIEDINEVRSGLSRLKAGRLVGSTAATVVTLVLSDVVGDEPHVVGSGPTIPSSLGFRGLDVYLGLDGTDVADDIATHLARWRPPPFRRADVVVTVGSPTMLAEAAADHLRSRGHEVTSLTSTLTGEVTEAADWVYRNTVPGTVSVAAGETTVSVTADGVGGRNLHAALSLVERLHREGGVFAAFGSDGIDGTAPAAGAVVTPDTYAMLAEAGWSIDEALAGFNSFPALDAVGAAVTTGPTGTNVCDLWICARDW